MSPAIVIFIVVVLLISIIGSALLLMYTFKLKKNRDLNPEYQPKLLMKNGKKIHIGISIFLIAFGLLFDSIGGGVIYNTQKETKSWDKVTAVVSYNNTRKGTSKRRTSLQNRRLTNSNVRVSYEYQDNTYEDISLNYNSSSMGIGKSVVILVNPDQPDEININLETTIGFMSIFIVVGSIVLIIGLYSLIRALRGNSKRVTQDK